MITVGGMDAAAEHSKNEHKLTRTCSQRVINKQLPFDSALDKNPENIHSAALAQTFHFTM